MFTILHVKTHEAIQGIILARQMIEPTFLLRHLSQARETLLRRGAFESEPSSMEEGVNYGE